MRIALLPDDYLPDSTRCHAMMIHELAVEFVRRGHEVVVITPGSWDQPKKLIIDYIDGVEVWRFRSKPTRDVGRIYRAINESLLSWRAYVAIKNLVKTKPFHLCVNYSPTIFFGPLAVFLKKKGAFVYLILRDFFPQWVIDEGIIKDGSPVAHYFRFFERLNYRVSDCVALQSPANISVFKKIYPYNVNLNVLMNWTTTNSLQRSCNAELFLKEYKLDDKLIFFYGGNIGHAQDMSNVLRLARGLLDHQHIHFLLVGQGDEYSLVEKLIEEWHLDNVTILPSVPQDKYRELLSVVDVGVFSLSTKHAAHNFPGKLLGYMAQSLPILGSVNEGNDVIEIINNSGAGFVSVNGDDKILLNNALQLACNSIIREKMGENSHQLLKDSFSVVSAADSILDRIRE